MRILREESARDDATALDRAWERAETFAFLPRKSAVDDAWVEEALASLPEPMHAGHFALLTSGSTGRPKLIVGERGRAERLVALLHEVQEGEAAEETILTLPLSYCYAFVNQWLWARRLDRRLVATEGFGAPDALQRALEGAESAMLCLVRAQVPLLERHFAGAVHPGVVRIHFAGGPFPQHALGDLAQRFPNARVFNNYGCAEAMPRLTIRRAEDGDSTSDVGRPLPGVELGLLPDGELGFRSPFGAVAFVEEGGVTLLAGADWIPTGDHAEAGPDGSWRLLGRANQVFKRYGEKIALGQLLDTVAAGWSGEAQFYRERDGMDEEGFVLLLAPSPAEEDVRAILKAFRAKHPRTHWPLRVESAERLPVLPNGKVDLAALGALEGKTVHWRNRI